MSPPRHVVARERAVRLENEKNTMDYYNAMRCDAMRLRVRSIGVILLKRDVLLQIELESRDVGEEIGFVQRPAQLCVLRAQRGDGCLLRLDLFPRVSQFVAFAQTKPLGIFIHGAEPKIVPTARHHLSNL